jgi:hypothetical protein
MTSFQCMDQTSTCQWIADLSICCHVLKHAHLVCTNNHAPYSHNSLESLESLEKDGGDAEGEDGEDGDEEEEDEGAEALAVNDGAELQAEAEGLMGMQISGDDEEEERSSGRAE